MEETTNKQEPWPTHLFDCCSGSIFSFLFCDFCLCFHLFKKKKGECEGDNLLKNNILKKEE